MFLIADGTEFISSSYIVLSVMSSRLHCIEMYVLVLIFCVL